jgi:glucokinase
VFYVTLGSGVGGGMIDHGEIYHGAVPGESEIGLMIYDKSGLNIESQCSGWAMDAKIREYISENPDSVLARLVKTGSHSEAQFLHEAIKQGDTGANQLLEESTDILAWGLSHVTHLFHPEIIILGGGLSLIGEKLREKVSIRLKKYVTKVFQPGPEIRIATLGEDVVSVGALLLAIISLKENNL